MLGAAGKAGPVVDAASGSHEVRRMDAEGRRAAPAGGDDLARHQIVGFNRGGGNLPDRMLFRGEAAEVKLDAPIVSNDFYVSRSFIDLDLGIGYLPPPMDRAWRGQQALLRVLPEYSSLIATVYFVYPRQRFVPARVKSFIAYAIERADDFV